MDRGFSVKIDIWQWVHCHADWDIAENFRGVSNPYMTKPVYQILCVLNMYICVYWRQAMDGPGQAHVTGSVDLRKTPNQGRGAPS